MEKEVVHKTLSYHGKPYTVIGWREWVCLPDLGVDRIKAKIDTGARTSALHAFDIELFKANGKDMIRFDLHPLQRNDKKVVKCTAEVIDQINVKDSGAHRELRYVIRTTVILAGIAHMIDITLTNRRQMTFRMLLGRKALQHYYIIDPTRSFHT